MINELDNFYLEQKEPLQSCFLALRDIILSLDEDIRPAWKYSTAFFYFKKKPFCYLWYDKKTNEPYIGVVRANLFEHPTLEKGNRKRMKILKINPCADIPVELIQEVLSKAMEYY